MGALVGEGSSVFYHPTHLFFTPGLLWGRCCGSTDRAPAPVQHQGSAGSLLCFASLFYPKKLWEIGKNLELGMVVLPGGFTLRVGDEKKPSVVAQEPCVVTRGCCPVIHVPQALHIQVGLPGTGTVEVELISSVSREKLLAPLLDVALAHSSPRIVTGGVGRFQCCVSTQETRWG